MRVVANGVSWEGFSKVSVTKSMTSLVHLFQFSFYNDDMDEFPFDNNTEIQIYYKDTLLTTGYVDTIQNKVGAEGMEIQITGRSKTASLVDCSVLGNTSYKNTNVLDLIKSLAAPFDISVQSKVSLPVETFDFMVDEGLSVFENLNKKLIEHGILSITDSEGNLVLINTEKSLSKVPFLHGETLLEVSQVLNYSKRHSQYELQNQSSEEAAGDWGTSTSIKATATDSEIHRYRPLIIKSTSSLSQDRANKKVRWIASNRAATSNIIQAKVPFVEYQGNFVEINTLAEIDFPDSSIITKRSQMLVSDVTYGFGKEGYSSAVTFKRKDAYIPAPPTEVQKDEGLKW